MLLVHCKYNKTHVNKMLNKVTEQFHSTLEGAGVPAVSYSQKSIFILLGLRGDGTANPGSCDDTII